MGRAGAGPRLDAARRSPTRSPTAAPACYEPVSIACHGLLRAPPRDGEPVLVVGAGVIGLAALAALKGLFPRCPVTVLARHDHQAEAAAACGADHVVMSQGPAAPTSRSSPS